MSSWNHIVLEGYCFYKGEVYKDVPCCYLKPCCANILCLSGSEDESRCYFFAYGRASSSIVLTDDSGLNVNWDGFSCDESDNNEYIKKEKEWIVKWKKIIDENKQENEQLTE